MAPSRTAIVLLALTIVSGAAAFAQRTRPAPLAATDVDAIAQLLKLEDTRQFDQEILGRLIKSAHPEVRRRAIISIGRIVDPRGRALLAGLRADPNPEIRATVAFSTGQLKDPDAVGWLGEQLAGPRTPTAVAFEAARALGKIRTPEARARARGVSYGRAGDGRGRIDRRRSAALDRPVSAPW